MFCHLSLWKSTHPALTHSPPWAGRRPLTPECGRTGSRPAPLPRRTAGPPRGSAPPRQGAHTARARPRLPPGRTSERGAGLKGRAGGTGRRRSPGGGARGGAWGDWPISADSGRPVSRPGLARTARPVSSLRDPHVGPACPCVPPTSHSRDPA